MPLKSFHLLPSEYKTIATGHLSNYFPLEFEVDLNGKTLAWEAITLIPFCDETLFLKEESILIEKGFTLSNEDQIRNCSVFEIFAYNLNKIGSSKILKSTLKSFTTVVNDLTQVTLIKEYENVGTMSFKSALLPGVKKPSPGYPSFEYLGIRELQNDHKLV